jgi:hypothetical protein
MVLDVVDGQAKPAGHVVHDVWLPTEKRPAAHAGVSTCSVVEHAEPAGHGVHALWLPVLYVPSAQSMANA